MRGLFRIGGASCILVLIAAAERQSEDGQIRGRVADSALSYVRNALIRLMPEESRETRYRVRTGADGTFLLDGIKPGSYAMAAWSPGFRERFVPVIVQTGSTTEVGEIQLQLVSCNAPSIICDDFFTPSTFPDHWPTDNTYSRGEIKLDLGCAVDVDKGKAFSKVTRSVEFRLQSDDSGRLLMMPLHGALLAQPNSAGLSCEGARYSKEAVRVAGLGLGSDLCLRTNEGRNAQIFFTEEVAPNTANLRVTYITWKK